MHEYVLVIYILIDLNGSDFAESADQFRGNSIQGNMYDFNDVYIYNTELVIKLNCVKEKESTE